MRDLWDFDSAAQPLLALLCAAARNDVLRGTAAAIFEAPAGTVITPDRLVAGKHAAHPLDNLRGPLEGGTPDVYLTRGQRPPSVRIGEPQALTGHIDPFGGHGHVTDSNGIH